MTTPYAKVGSLTQNGDKIITGASSAFVDGGSSTSGSVTVDGQTVVFSEADTTAMLNDSPEAEGQPLAHPPIAKGKATPAQLAKAAQLAGPDRTSSATAPAVNNSTTPVPSDCTGIASNVPYNFRLSTNFILNDVTLGAFFPHSVVAQAGLSPAQIVCNLKNVAINCLEPLVTKYGRSKMLITSGFRPESGTLSQHGKGQACDIQFPTFTNDQLWAAALWVKDNIAYDQFILEVATYRPWFHLSFNSNGAQRKQVLSMHTVGGIISYQPHGLFRYF